MVEILMDEAHLFAAHSPESGLAVVLIQRDGFVVSWERSGDVLNGPTLTRHRTVQECADEWLGCVNLASA